MVGRWPAEFLRGADESCSSETVPTIASTFSVVCWNINGDLALKLASPDFVSLIEGYDVVILLETHVLLDEGPLNVPTGYTLISHACKSKSEWNRVGGGVAMLVREGIRFTVSNLSFSDTIVLDLGWAWLIGSYIAPASSRWENWTDVQPIMCLWEVLAIVTSMPGKPCMLLTDINARTASLATMGVFRNSADSGGVTTRGRDLLNICKESDLCILNGTAYEQNSPGRYTSFQAQGCAVVDYAIVSEELLPMVLGFHVCLPADDPDEDWADHAAIVLQVDGAQVQYVNTKRRPAPRGTPTVARAQECSTLDVQLAKTMSSVQTPAEAARALYGAAYIRTEGRQVYTDGSCFHNGMPDARAGSGVFWEHNAGKNISLRVPGPEPQSNNCGEILAIVVALQQADPYESLVVFSDSQHAIRHACYWAVSNAAEGWRCPNGDMLKDMVLLLRGRVATTTFVWVETHSGNEWGDEADRLAKLGAGLPEIDLDYSPMDHLPWPCNIPLGRPALEQPKVFTTLPEVSDPRPKAATVEVTGEDVVED